MNFLIMERGVIETLSSVLKVVCHHDDGDSSSRVTLGNLEVIAETCVQNEYIRHEVKTYEISEKLERSILEEEQGD